jgi:hypothetical protein
MDIATTYVDAIEQLVATLGISHDMAHVHGGLALYLAAQFVLGDRRGSPRALLVVMAAEFANELLEAMHYGSWRWHDTAGDIVATLLWPSMLLLVSWHRRRRWERRAVVARQMAFRTARA